MSCCDYFEHTNDGATSFTVAMPRLTVGPGTLGEVGARLRARGLTRVALFTDPFLAKSEHLTVVRESLRNAAVEFEEYADVRIEPTDVTCLDAARFYGDSNAMGAIAVGGGSVIDTAKAAIVYATHPADFCDYLGPPIGPGQPIPVPLPPLFACPTTGGTGSEATAVAVVKIESLDTKFVLQSPWMLPVRQLSIQIARPLCRSAWSPQVALIFSVTRLNAIRRALTRAGRMSRNRRHALPCRAPIHGVICTRWRPYASSTAIWSVRFADKTDVEARGKLMWGATLAGMAFGNSGTHLPHAFSYGVSHLAKTWHSDQYPMDNGRFIPHGISVAVNAPSVYR